MSSKWGLRFIADWAHAPGAFFFWLNGGYVSSRTERGAFAVCHSMSSSSNVIYFHLDTDAEADADAAADATVTATQFQRSVILTFELKCKF